MYLREIIIKKNIMNILLAMVELDNEAIFSITINIIKTDLYITINSKYKVIVSLYHLQYFIEIENLIKG